MWQNMHATRTAKTGEYPSDIPQIQAHVLHKMFKG